MYCIGLDIDILSYWTRMKMYILEQLTNDNIDNDKLWTFAKENVFNIEFIEIIDIRS